MFKHSAFCVKCQAETRISALRRVRLNNGARAIKGKCPRCASAVYRIIPAHERRSLSPMRSFIFGMAISFSLTLAYVAVTKHDFGRSLNQAVNSLSLK